MLQQNLRTFLQSIATIAILLVIAVIILATTLPSGAEPQKQIPEIALQTGHNAKVNSVAFSPTGTRIASGSDDGTVILWDANTGEQIFRLKEFNDRIAAVAFSPDGKEVLASGSNGSLLLWNVKTGALIHQFKGLKRAIGAIAFSPDGNRIICSAFRQGLIIWDTKSGKPIKQFGLNEDFITSVAFTPDGTRVVSAGFLGNVALWEASSGRPIQKFEGSASMMAPTIAISPDGATVVGSLDGGIVLWNTATGKKIGEMKDKLANVRDDSSLTRTSAVAFNHTGTQIASTNSKGFIIIRDAQTGDQIQQISVGKRELRDAFFGSFTFSPHSINSITFSPDNNRVIAGLGDHFDKFYGVNMWDVTTGKSVREFKGHTTVPVKSTAFTPDGSQILSCSDGLTLWDAKTGVPVKQCYPDEKIDSVAFRADGTEFVTAGKNLRLWNTKTFEPIKTFENINELESYRCVAFSPDGSQILSGYQDLVLWDAKTGVRRKLIGHYQQGGQTAIIESVAFSRDGSRFVSTASDALTILWDSKTGNQILQFQGRYNSNAFSPDGTRVACGEDAVTLPELNFLVVRDLLTGRETLRINEFSGKSLAVNPEGTKIACGGRGGALVLWNVMTGEKLRTFQGSTAEIESVAFSPDGSTICTGNGDGTLNVWDAQTGHRRGTMINLENRNWLTVTPEGCFEGSVNASQYIRWRFGDKLYPFADYEKVLHRHDFVERSLQGIPLPANLNTISSKGTPPSILISCRSIAGGAEITATATPSDNRRKITRLEINVNGRLIPLKDCKEIKMRPGEEGYAANSIRVRGTARFEEYAPRLEIVGFAEDSERLTSRNHKSFPANSTATKIGEPMPLRGKTHLLTFGVREFQNKQYNLPLGRASAELMSKLLAAQSRKAILDKNVTVNSITDALEAECQTVEKGDLFILYLGMHGIVANQGESYWLIPHNGDPTNLEKTCMSWRILSGLLQKVRQKGCYVLVLLDACHSGFASTSKSALSNDLLAAQIRNEGIAVFSASSENESAWEPGIGEASYFVQAIKKVVQSYQAKSLTLEKFCKLVQAEVVRSVRANEGKTQTPQLRVPEEIESMKNLLIMK